ncbi:MAG: type I-E CRISPR-associated protein Cas6/Cse3/CasE [Roseomonas mucosa]|uniref:type I-E CRISPR-associated protein Cas6/Cse3/CasE n=1 Tax=Roseomonas mucosa TaxID=207340 RepID=UPI001EF4924B|nr:type I-E CRISPR-associated protein Cas6/Cse3/CasE [Roseomonas mucosa]MCG7354751.1 type I-E CRISPR-associated protein Cas6/Cse3/CasE [Roseomonas mucosa]MDU7522636.1 type I-E CRISPR-associated protein Cas6/Cse3/CasE [Roseomonas mucosa]
MSLVMLHLPVSQRRLLASGREHGLVRDAWSVDPGYLVHALFARLFGKVAPKPFDIQEERSEGGDRLSVLAYAPCGHDVLAALAGPAGDAAATIDWDAAGSRIMPGFAAGQRLGFRLRACPVVRIGRQHSRFQPGAEVDPYVALIQRHLAEALRDAPDAPEAEVLRIKQEIVRTQPSREVVYQDWLAARIETAAVIEAARVSGLRDARLWRRGVPGEGAAGTMQGYARPTHAGRAAVGRRDAVFEGVLRVADPAAFVALLARGVGRHRAFGFGMLLLRPSGS